MYSCHCDVFMFIYTIEQCAWSQNDTWQHRKPSCQTMLHWGLTCFMTLPNVSSRKLWVLFPAEVISIPDTIQTESIHKTLNELNVPYRLNSFQLKNAVQNHPEVDIALLSTPANRWPSPTLPKHGWWTIMIARTSSLKSNCFLFVCPWMSLISREIVKWVLLVPVAVY